MTATQYAKYHGIINSNLITPKFLMEMLTNLPQKQQKLFPVELRDENFHYIYNLAEGAIIRRDNKRLHMIITIPISELKQK